MSTRASETEKHTILVDFNQTKSVGEIQETVVDLIEQQAALAPSSTALIFEETEMTYQELNERANQLAHRLIELGVKEETIVGLCIHRSIEMYIGILGIMKSGGAYLPIEPTLPTGRMQYMLEDAKANIVLSNTASKDGVEELEQLTLVELNDTKIQNAPVENVELKLKPTRLAYVIYTSGSTGAPKGVMIQHNSLTNLQLVMKDALQADHTTSFLSLASYGFDMSCLELYLPLTVGGQLMLARVGLAADGYVLKELINKHKPSHMQATASTWQILIDSGWKNEEGVVIMTGGEPTSEMLKNQLVQLSTSRVLNMYGPTEATVWATMDVLTLEKKISIGKPLANYQVYILDEEDQLSAIGEIGELCIAGVGLARGYLNREALTQEKFVTSVNQDLTGTRIYRTGDLARWLPDGTIECLGRKDSQVKVRGYRIELGEIEAVFQAMSAIHSVVVLIKEGKNEAKNLVAFVVKHAEITTDELLEAAKTFLPDYMLPTFFVELDELPRNANGKIDRKALAQFDVFSMQNSIYEAPKTPIERQIVAIWEDLLGRERIGRDEHFFKLGGHSLLATRVVSALRNIYTIELTITDLFKHSTVKELAHYVESLEKKEKIVIEAAERPELVPLSFAQERLWFIDQLEGSVNYHIPYVFFINGRLDQAALAQAFQSVINRHEALRTVFKSSKGEAYQYVLAENTWELERSVVQGTSDQLERFIQQQLEKPFNLETDHMLRAHLMECSEQEHYLLVVIHHIAADGWSLPILMEELNHFYTCHKHHTASDLAPLPIQYADFALWQKARLSGEVLAKKMLYWEEKLKDIKTITLPEDFERPNKLSRAGKTLKFLLKKELSTKLYDFARQENATLFMVMLSVFKVLLHKYSNQTDICVGSGIANRTQSEIESLIGFFVNAIVIRSDLSAPLTFQELLQQIKATTLEAYHNQEVPFEKVVDRIEQNRDLSRDPLFQVLFVVQNTPGDDTLFLNELKVKEVTPSNQTSKFDLYFDITETADGLVLAIEYNADIFASSTIMRMKEQYELLLAAAIANPHRKIEQLELIDARTQKQLLESFNNTSFAYPREKHVPMLFEQQVKRNPSSVALAFGKEQLTYAQLNEKSNQVAHYLIDKGIQPEDLVGLCIERSMNTIIAIVGIVKAGAAYVPIDPEYPTERIKFMMQDVAMDMMITESKYVALFQEKVQHLLLLDEASELLEGYANSNPEIELTANQLAYVMYTSGSTGNPKGVLIEHRAIVRLIFSKEFEFLTDYSVLYQYAPITFDASTFEIWGALLKGGKLVIALPTQLSLEAIAKELQQHNVNTLWLTAGLFHSAIDSCMELFSPISYMLSGGDSIRVESIQALLTTYPEITFINGYGPTESTTFTSINRVDNVEQLVSHQNCIGKPISNTQVYILSEGGSILPVGAIGELHIGGDGLARAYHNQKELTDEKFIPNPFATETSGERLYKSGDLARWLPNGSIEYVGRKDQQVKVRGYRIELGEIESQLNQLDGVGDCSVVVQQTRHLDKQLVNFFVPDLEALKQKEDELCLEQVSNWESIYEKEYGEAEGFEDDFNITGWVDTFTNQPIPEVQMREWLQDISGFILRRNPKKVLEIGCGTGLIYYQLIDHIQEYIGTDLSQVCVDQLSNSYQKNSENYPLSSFTACPAHAIQLPENTQVDTIIINSVVQYFPGASYLEDLLTHCFKYFDGTGQIILGDIRDNRLQTGFKGRIKLAKLATSANLDDFAWEVEQEILKDNELCISPTYFYQLQAKYPPLSHVELEWKQGDGVNEMMLYRYNAVLHIGEKQGVSQVDWQDWANGKQAEYFQERIHQEVEQLALTNVPVTRLWKELEIHTAIQENKLATLEELSRLTEAPNAAMQQAQALFKLAQDKGYHVRFIMTENPFVMDVMLSKQTNTQLLESRYVVDANALHQNATNFPLFEEAALVIQKEMKEALSTQLPAYMLPDKHIALQQLPLTANGKVNKRFLQQVQLKSLARSAQKAYSHARNETEKALVKIWEELLQFEGIGIEDNFFELGGHSLLATRVVSAIRKEMGIVLPIKAMFEFKCIANLSEYIDLMTASTVEAEEETEVIDI